MSERLRALLLAAACLGPAGAAAAPAAIESPPGGPNGAPAEPAFDIVRTEIRLAGEYLVFRMQVAGRAGAVVPTPTGRQEGAEAFAYVWPTRLDSAAVGFEPGQGILALAATAHPDFDDTPLEDENGDGNPNNDGGVWHSHWVVLVPDEACGPGALKVRDIPPGARPRLPPTWPGLPILLDSPGHRPAIAGPVAEIRIPRARIAAETAGVAFDGVTAGLRVNASLHAPLLCVARVFDVASGGLTLPGRIE
ncbi:hypothetical protein [Caldovatus aquaticus]|uniref:Uncharacterized protein n=1 Tax=Caldovatus aquaticus TaxID=2865671 RepID=A0ABS7F276_9PROT|nr:hypothetical protein [Caldovatus aquaticus]MBW8269694.1 hypothetical protein [Caldovatus aquaticus]